jgi:hypothetical protein
MTESAGDVARDGGFGLRSGRPARAGGCGWDTEWNGGDPRVGMITQRWRRAVWLALYIAPEAAA